MAKNSKRYEYNGTGESGKFLGKFWTGSLNNEQVIVILVNWHHPKDILRKIANFVLADIGNVLDY